MSIDNVVKAIAVTAELTGATLSVVAVATMAKDLMDLHREEAILRALNRCRKELTRPLTAGAVFERLDQDDGRPSSDEAWAIALQSVDEAATVVWNAEISRSLSAARSILDAGDKVGARMAFRDAYDKLVRQNRESGIKPKWEASLGWDQDIRAAVLTSAQEHGLLPAPTVAALLPAPGGGVVEAALFGGQAVPCDDDSGRVAQWISRIKSELAAARAARFARQEAKAKAEREELAERKRKVAADVAAELEKRARS